MPLREADRDPVVKAVRELERATEAVTEAERMRDEADAALDRALAERGWRRAGGAFSALLYESPVAPGFLVERRDVLAAIEQDRRVA